VEYFEIAVSDGQGTLVSHEVFEIASSALYEIGYMLPENSSFIMETLSAAEAEAFKAIHSGWVAV
jgi:hypothetical protein